MLVFISWSGKKSRIVAEFLESWLRQVIQAIDPWISSDISKGLRWSPEISAKLELSKVGIICLTKDNLDSKWILFESGALSKTKDAHVCTLLIGLNSSDIEHPLAQFQHTSTEKEDFKQLLITINKALAKCDEKSLPENTLEEIFEMYWPRLEQKFIEIESLNNQDDTPARSEKDILQEILETVRNQERKINALDYKLFTTISSNRIADIFSNKYKHDIRLNEKEWHSFRSMILHYLDTQRDDSKNLFDQLKNGDSESTETNDPDKSKA